MARLFILLLLTNVSMFAAVAHAHEDEATLTLAASVTNALAWNPELRAASHEVAKARARIKQAGVLPNPELSISTQSSRFFSNSSESISTLELSQTFPVTRRLTHERSLAKLDLLQAQIEILDFQRKLVGDVQKEFVSLIALQERAAIMINRESLLLELLSLLQKALQAAEASSLDVHLMNFEIQNLQQEKIGLETQLDAGIADFKKLIGLSASTNLKLKGSLQEMIQQFSNTPLQDCSLPRRPDLQKLILECNSANLEKKLAESHRWEDLTVGVLFEQERSRSDSSDHETVSYCGFRLSLPLPLWNRNAGKIEEKRAGVLQIQQQIQALRNDIEAEIQTARNRGGKLKAMLDQYESGLLPRMEKSIEMIVNAYQSGQADPARLYQMHSQLSDAQLKHTEIQQDYLHASIDLQTACSANPELLALDELHPTKNRSME